MPIYMYDALTLSGERVSGRLDAPSREQAHDQLRRGGMYPKRIEEEAQGHRKRVKPLDADILSVLLRQLASMLASGVTLIKCLEILSHNADKPRVRELLSKALEDMRSGASLSAAMGMAEGAFPALLIQMVRAGEAGGSLPEAFEAAASQFENQAALNQRLRGALTYPAVVLGLAVAVVIFLMTGVLPTFGAMFEQSGAELPLMTRLLLGASAFVADNLIFILAGLFIVVLVCRRVWRMETVRLFISRRVFFLWVAGDILRDAEASRYARTLSALLGAGVPFVSAMGMAGDVVNNAYAASLMPGVESAVKGGGALGTAMRELDWVPPLLVSMIALGEESGTLVEMLARAADQMDAEASRAVTRFTALLEPGIMIFLGLIVGFIVVSVLMPMFTLSQTMGL